MELHVCQACSAFVGRDWASCRACGADLPDIEAASPARELRTVVTSVATETDDANHQGTPERAQHRLVVGALLVLAALLFVMTLVTLAGS